MNRIYSLLVLFCLSYGHSGFSNKPASNLKPGSYRAMLERADGNNIVFNFEVSQVNGKTVIDVINAKERLRVTDIRYERDSVRIEMPFFDAGFRAKINSAEDLEGSYIKRIATTDQVMPFHAKFNETKRFPVSSAARGNVNGRWAVKFLSASGSSEAAIGEFIQQNNRVSGTFLTPTGDYRYLEGVVSGDSLYLSCFDGGHAFLFTAKINGENSITDGKFYSGMTGTQSWTGTRDANASLPDGYTATRLKEAGSALDFTFPDLNGKPVSIKDKRYQGKVVVIQIMGSWCPNCMDETNFLSEYYSKNQGRGFEVMALAYERSTDFKRSQKSLQSFQQRFNVKYPMLITGVTVTDSLRAEKTLPQIEKIVAFPTSIFLDKAGKVRKIYTGFSGPGTGAHYLEFKKEFEATINELLAEKI